MVLVMLYLQRKLQLYAGVIFQVNSWITISNYSLITLTGLARLRISWQDLTWAGQLSVRDVPNKNLFKTWVQLTTSYVAKGAESLTKYI